MIRGNTVRFSAYTIDPDALRVLAENLRGKRVGIISGNKSWDAVSERMPILDCCCHVRYGSECTMAAIDEAAETCAQAGAEVVLGVGGGKALDVAKGAAYKLGLPAHTVPTIAATCAAVTALCIVYHPDGKLDQFIFLDAPPVHAYLDTTALVQAPLRYFRAGLGDSLAKNLECVFSMRGDTVNYVNSLGAAISETILNPLLGVGVQAYRECEAQQAGDAFVDALQRMIVSVGLTSLLVEECYNGAVAHSLCYGLGALPGVEHRVLHGELVGYGCLVQLMLDGDEERMRAVRSFLQAIQSPVSLAEMEIDADEEVLAPVLAETLRGPDMAHLPYPVTREMLYQAMMKLEPVQSL